AFWRVVAIDGTSLEPGFLLNRATLLFPRLPVEKKRAGPEGLGPAAPQRRVRETKTETASRSAKHRRRRSGFALSGPEPAKRPSGCWWWTARQSACRTSSTA